MCRDCAEWLLHQVGVSSTPTLPVANIAEAADFYRRAGFGVRLYSDDAGSPADGFAFVDFDGQSVFDLDAAPDLNVDANRAGCYLVADDPDAWHARMRAAGLAVTEIADEPWGMREFALNDPSGNRVRIGRGIGEDEASV